MRIRQPRLTDWLSIAFILVLAWFLFGCGRQTPEKRLEHIANSDAGLAAAAVPLDALRIAAGNNPASLAAVADLENYLSGARSFLIASNDGKPLPAATVQVANPQDYAKAADGAKKAAGGWTMAGMAAAGVVILGVFLRVAKNLPGIAGVCGTLAEFAFRQIAPAKAVDADAKAQATLQSAIQYGHAVTGVAVAWNPQAVEEIKAAARAAQVRLGIDEHVTDLLNAVKAGARPAPSYDGDHA